MKRTPLTPVVFGSLIAIALAACQHSPGAGSGGTSGSASGGAAGQGGAAGATGGGPVGSGGSDAAGSGGTIGGSGGMMGVDGGAAGSGGSDAGHDAANTADAADGTGGGAGAPGDAGVGGDAGSGASDASTGRDARDGSASSDAGAVYDAAGGDARDASVSDGTSGGGDGPLTYEPWPGTNAVSTIDTANFFGTDLSGLMYQPAAGSAPAVLWGVQNNPGKLYRLLWNGSLYVADTAGGWSNGKTLRYPGGSGSPDSEGVTIAEWTSGAVYIAAERDNSASGTSRLSILRYDTAGSSSTLTATDEWNLTSGLPSADANKGIEGIAWIPDTYLTQNGFFDEAAGKTYVPGDHANHGTGLFFIGMEGDGHIYAYALDHQAHTAERLATIVSGQPGVMDLFFDRDVGTLWVACDEVCNNQTTLFDIDVDAASATRGRFRARRGFARPSTLPNKGNEGITIAPESECAAGGGMKVFLWADDSNTDGHALRRDTIPCGPLY